MKEKVPSEKSMVHYDLCSNRARNKSLGVFLVMCTAFLHRKGMTHPCGFPGRPRNGSSLTASTVSRPGDTAQYSCRPGYTLFGDEERVCLESGIWAGRQPICELNLVLEKPALMSAQLWNYKPGLAVDGNIETCSFTPRTSEQRWWQVDLMVEQHIGSVALVISQDSYHELTIFIIELVSRSEALYKPCVHFKGRFPKSRMLFSCNKGKGHKGRYVYIRDDRKDHDYFGLCEVEVFAYRDNSACGDPEEAVGSKVLVVGETAIYSCLPGYQLVDSPNRTCEQGGHWTGHSPQCRAISCGDPPKIDHAEIEMVNHSTTWNSLAMYTCKAGYFFPQGPLWSIQCLENGIWEPVNLTCITDDDSRHQLAVKSRDEGRRNSDVKTSLGSTHTVVSAGIISSVLITIIVAVGIILIRRHQAKNRYNSTPQSSSNDLISPNSKNTLNETPLSPPMEQPESTVLYTVVEASSRELMDNVTQESTMFVQQPPTKEIKPCVSPEILALYSQIDLSKKKRPSDPNQRESCKISKECDCARYNLAEDLARYSIDGSPGRQQMQPMLPIPVPIPQVCLLPASKHQLLQTMTSDKL